LEWWKNHPNNPQLAAMARDVFSAVPVLVLQVSIRTSILELQGNHHRQEEPFVCKNIGGTSSNEEDVALV